MIVLATVDWIGAVASVVVAGLALAGIAAYLLQRQDQRLQFGPILRVDIGPNEVVGDWQPPEADRERDFAWEFTLLDESPVAERDIFIWIRNTQSAPAGVAWDVGLFIEIDLPPEVAHEIELAGPIRVVYLEAETTMRVRVLRVSQSISAFSVRLVAIQYRNRLMRVQRDTHGRLDCSFDGSGFSMRSRTIGEELRRPWRWMHQARRLFVRGSVASQDD